jgi:hypothetical protein
MGRGLAKRRTPFRFILNHSKATVTNTYLILYPRPFLEGALEKDPTLARRIWLTLNQIDSDKMLGEGRIYGGGLHKIEPKELGNVPAEMIGAVVREIPCHGTGQQELFGQSVPEV